MPSLFSAAFGHYSALNSWSDSPFPVDRIHSILTTLQSQLTEYISFLERLSDRITSGQIQANKSADEKWGRALAERLAKHTTLINELWLGFETALVDEEASEADFIPVTREGIQELRKAGKIRFHTLPTESDELRRLCAGLTAQMDFRLQELVDLLDEHGLAGLVVCESTEELR